MTDYAAIYDAIGREFRSHETVNHGAGEYVRGKAHTNTAESFFAIVKRQMYGTHHTVSEQHLQRYVSEAAFKWNNAPSHPLPATSRPSISSCSRCEAKSQVICSVRISSSFSCRPMISNSALRLTA